jgi:hypothetical protein
LITAVKGAKDAGQFTDRWLRAATVENYTTRGIGPTLQLARRLADQPVTFDEYTHRDPLWTISRTVLDRFSVNDRTVTLRQMARTFDRLESIVPADTRAATLERLALAEKWFALTLADPDRTLHGARSLEASQRAATIRIRSAIVEHREERSVEPTLRGL